MKMLGLALFLLTAGFSIADPNPNPNTQAYLYDEFYILVIPYGASGLFIDLRRTGNDRVLDSKWILSRYMSPEYEMRDVTSDGQDEILVYTKTGGIGVASRNLTVYAINGSKLVEVGNFELERALSVDAGGCEVSLPDGTKTSMPVKEGRIKGSVEFLPDGRIQYFYVNARRECTDLKLDFKIKNYRFNSVTCRFEQQSF